MVLYNTLAINIRYLSSDQLTKKLHRTNYWQIVYNLHNIATEYYYMLTKSNFQDCDQLIFTTITIQHIEYGKEKKKPQTFFS